MAVGSLPSIEHLRDYIICKSATIKCPGEIPECFRNQDVLRTMETICIDFRLAGFIESAEIRALGIGTLLDELIGRMKSIAAKHDSGETTTTETNFVLLSSHDTTLAAMLITLEAEQEVRWPDFSTTLVFELFSRQEEESIHYYVRLLWNDQIVSIPRLDRDRPNAKEEEVGLYSLVSRTPACVMEVVCADVGQRNLLRIVEERMSRSSMVSHELAQASPR